jgi:Flp pilus assembly protein TadG
MSIARPTRPGNRSWFLNRFRRDRRGAAAAEFSLILPVALVLFTGAITYGNAIYIDRKVTLTARTVTDLVTQYTTMHLSDVQTVLGASAKIIAPFDTSVAVVRVSEVTTDASGVGKVVWSVPTANGVKRAIGSTVALPTAIAAPNVTFIYGEVTYVYTPSIGYQVTGSITLTDQAFMSPRQSSTVPCPDC